MKNVKINLNFRSLANVIHDGLELIGNQPFLFSQHHVYSGNDMLAMIASIQAIFMYHHISIGDRKIIALLLPKRPETVAIIYAILLYGCIYIPMDDSQPEERLGLIFADVQPDLVISNRPCPVWFSTKNSWHVLLDKPIDVYDKPSVCEQDQPETIATILYTSGSTGKPKGIAISHRAILAFINWASSQFDVLSRDRIASLAPFHFDLSLFDLFVSIRCCASLYLVPKMLATFPSQLVLLFVKESITILYTVPSLLIYLSRFSCLADTKLTALRLILFAGESYPITALLKLLDLLPATVLFNLYGPTETNVITYWQVDKDYLICQQQLPIGLPTPYAHLTIDHVNQELMVKTDTLFSGYYRLGQIEKPMDMELPYSTRDAVSSDSRGNFLYRGRLDRMIKYKGHRIEPGEIEIILDNYPNIEQSVVILTNDSEPTLVAYIQSWVAIDYKALRAYVAHKLPSYMQPHRYCFLKKLPTLTNGKVDLIQLKNREDFCVLPS